MNAGSAAHAVPPAGGTSPVDWGIAAATAQRLIRSGPVVPRQEADDTVRRLRAQSVIAEAHVREVTGLGFGLPVLPGEALDRPGWVRAAASGLSALTGRALPRGVSGPLSGVLAGAAGVQAGMVLAFLGSRVLGQYDPFGGDGRGRLLLVAPNIVAAQRALDVDAEDFRLWVCLHESTHRLQFTAVPWLREHFSAEVGQLMSIMEESTRLPELLRSARERIRSVDGGSGVAGLVDLLQSPEQRRVLDRLVAMSTLLEGHADHVMDAVGPAVVPSVATIRSRFSVRRKGGGLFDRLLRALLGVEAKVRQYAEGAAFTRHVVDAVGMPGFNAVWTSPETLPARAEIADPDAWLRRVHG